MEGYCAMDLDFRSRFRTDFFKLSTMGRADEGDADQRCHVSVLAGMDMLSATVEGRRVSDWPYRVEIEIDNRVLIEDVPWACDMNFIASDRFRDFVELFYPDHAQFLPVKTKYKVVSMSDANYWIVNWTRIVSCMNVSIVQLKRTMSKKYIFNHDLIPSDVVVFRPLERPGVLLARVSFRDAIERAGITGCQFYPIVENAS